MASMATVTLLKKECVSPWIRWRKKVDYLPSVPFLKPMGKETPDASSRCNWDSVVRAPIAPQEMT
jgi:hypothetical protein